MKMDFKAVEKLIQEGKLGSARLRLKQMTKLEEMAPSQLLTYFRLVRRVGDFHRGSLIVEKLESIYPELGLERAYFLGELGAYQQALLLLDQNRQPIPDLDPKIEKQMYLGHLASLNHDYGSAIQAYQQMSALAEKERPVQYLIGRLNEIGHRIYAGENLKEKVRELEEFRLQYLKSYPLLEQGSFYFKSLALWALEDPAGARRELKNAFESGVQHRLRESLLLKITDFEFNAENKSKIQISRLKKMILEQNNIVYFDQFNKIMGRHLQLQKEENLARKYFFKVLYGNRPSTHLKQVASFCRKDLAEFQSGWLVDQTQARGMTHHQFIYNQVEKKKPPYLENGKKAQSLLDVSDYACNLILKLSQNFEFQMRDAELWQSIWDQHYLYSNSLDRLKSLLLRVRKSPLNDWVQITYNQHKLHLNWKKGTSLIRTR